MHFEGTVFCKEVHQTLNYGLDILFLRLFHECHIYGYLIFDCETSKQLEHKNSEMLGKHLEEVFFDLVLKIMQF